MKPLKCIGVNRFSDNDQILGFHFTRKPDDDELRILHDVVKAALDGIIEGREIVEAGGEMEENEKLFAATKGQKPN